MTLAELNEYLDLIESLANANNMLESLYASAFPGGQGFSGMPHAPGIKDKVGDLGIEIAEVKTTIEYIKSEIKNKEETISVFISGIDDIQLRMIFRLRFQRALSWKEVAGVIGSGNTKDGVKSACYRYLEKLQRDDAS